MKCPKCGYIGFEPSDRCKNCGYEFSLSRQQPAEDLSMQPGGQGAPLADFDLGEARRPSRTPPGQRRLDPALDPGVDGFTPAADLPLFGGGEAEGPLPLVVTGAPTPPLSVRRSSPAVRRDRSRPTPRPPEPEQRLRFGAFDEEEPEPPARQLDAGAVPAPAGARLSAALLDWMLLAAIDLAVVYFTLRICHLSSAELDRLPLVPLGLFFALLNGGYLALLTGAGGQTIGKMAFDLKVVGRDGEAVPVPAAVVRTLALLLSALPAGLGLATVLFDRSGRGLHDRLSRTRVIGVRS